MTVTEKLAALRQNMEARGLEGCIVVTDDFHGSEYVGAHFKAREFLSGFTGSAGTLTVLREGAYLWTDGRYFLQAERQLEGSGIQLMRAGQPGVPTLSQFLAEQLPESGALGFDGRTVSTRLHRTLEKALADKHIRLDGGFDPAAGVWTDGRYFLQAERQLEGSGIQLMRAGQPGVPTLSQFLAEQLPESGALGFDGRTVSTRLHRTLEKALADKHIRLDGGFDPAAGVWTDRPDLSTAPVWAFDSGVTRREKLTALRQDMAAQKAEWLLLTDLTDVTWALELRGGDVACTPVFLGFLLVGTDSAALYAQAESFAPEIRAALAEDSVALRPYGDIYDALRALPEGARVLADSATANSRIAECLAHTAWTDTPSPAARRKAVKAGSEQTGFRQAHLQDGAALCRFLYEMKTRPEAYTELSAAALLRRYRAEQADFLEDSFETIAAYGPHAAVVHYAPTPETDVPLKAQGLLLVDSGGHYARGTTDVTRTIALGPITDEERRRSTQVLQGHIQLAMAQFPQGVMGENLDALARGPLWREGLDYDHGTGHGVGCVLSVHEAPPSFRWRIAEGLAHPALETGMVISDEPGYYAAGRFGIRHENLLLVQPAEAAGFLRFETLTLAPFDRDALDPALLTASERDWLNGYHRRVYAQIAQLVPTEVRQWLREVTAAL